MTISGSLFSRKKYGEVLVLLDGASKDKVGTRYKFTRLQDGDLEIVINDEYQVLLEDQRQHLESKICYQSHQENEYVSELLSGT